MATGVKTGGRTKGTVNKKTQEFADKYEELAKKYKDPVEVLFAMIADDDADRPVKRAAASDLLQYRFAKLKAIEHSGEINHRTDANDLSDADLADIATSGRAGVIEQAQSKKVTH